MNPLDVALLRHLRAASWHLPGADLAVQLRVPLATVKDRIAALREAGFEIEQHPGLGYRLLDAADRLIADDLLARLGPCALIREITVLAETDSTNERVARLGRAGVAPGVAIFAERQTAGRGRFGRRWESLSHRGLWFSLLLRPALPLEAWGRLTTWAAIGLAVAIERHLGLGVGVKWPNDLQAGGRKVAGILAETFVDASGAPFAVVGIGVNVNHEPADFPAELAEKAGSLRSAAGRTIDRPALAAEILRSLDAQVAALHTDFPALVAAAARRSTLLGEWIALRAGAGVVTGLATGLDASGQLLLQLEDGTVRTLHAGEVTLLPRARGPIGYGK